MYPGIQGLLGVTLRRAGPHDALWAGHPLGAWEGAGAALALPSPGTQALLPRLPGGEGAMSASGALAPAERKPTWAWLPLKQSVVWCWGLCLGPQPH